MVEATPDLTPATRAERLEREHGERLAPTAVYRFFGRHGLKVKKSGHTSRQARPDTAAARDAWAEAQPSLDPAKLVFIDRAIPNTQVIRLRGHAARGERLPATIPHGHWRTAALVAGLSGLAVIIGDGFAAYLRQMRVPDLRPGHIAVAGNVERHKSAALCPAAVAAGAELRFPPPCGPDGHHIQNAFPWHMALLRKAAARTCEILRVAAAGYDRAGREAA